MWRVVNNGTLAETPARVNSLKIHVPRCVTLRNLCRFLRRQAADVNVKHVCVLW
jgi:2-C-methyl-D-erythritol 4-phosphate cytidylyltransferase